MSVYVIMNLIAATVLVCCAAYILKKEGQSWVRIVGLTLIMVSSFFIGARLLYAMLYYERIIAEPSILYEIRLVNFSLYGGLILGAVVWFFATKRIGVNFWAISDRLTAALGISIAISKLGCFLNGCCYGVSTSLPWGVAFEKADQISASRLFGGGAFARFITGQSIVHRHPTQLYEALFALLAAGVAFWLLRKMRHSDAWGQSRNGIPTLVFLLVFTIGRLISFAFRDFPHATVQSNFIRGPVTYGVIIISAGFMLYFVMKKHIPLDENNVDKER